LQHGGRQARKRCLAGALDWEDAQRRQ